MFGRFFPPPTRRLRPGEGLWALRAVAVLTILAGLGLLLWDVYLMAADGYTEDRTTLLIVSIGITVFGVVLLVAIRLWNRHV